MKKLSFAAILLIFIIAVMLVLNTALLHLLYGIEPADQLAAFTSLAVTGSFPGQEAPVSGESGRLPDKGAVRQEKESGQPAGTGGINATADTAASRSGEDTGANGRNNPAGEAGGSGEGYFLTLDEIGLLENMSLQDKLKAVSILSGVDRNVLDSAIKLAGDGITYDEYNELMDSADDYLDPTEIKTLEDILNRNIGLYAQGGR